MHQAARSEPLFRRAVEQLFEANESGIIISAALIDPADGDGAIKQARTAPLHRDPSVVLTQSNLFERPRAVNTRCQTVEFLGGHNTADYNNDGLSAAVYVRLILDLFLLSSDDICQMAGKSCSSSTLHQSDC